MKRLLIFINKENVNRYIDIFLNHGVALSFPQIIAYHFKMVGSFKDLEVLDILLKYRRGYNCGMGSKNRKRYFSDINEILKRNGDTGIRWIEREKPSNAFNESFEFFRVGTVRYEVSEDEGLRMIEEERDLRLDVADRDMSEVERNANKVIEDNNEDRIKVVKMISQKRKLSLYKDLFNKRKNEETQEKKAKKEVQIKELKEIIKESEGKLVSMTKSQREKIKSMSPYYGIEESDILSSKEIDFVKSAKSERARLESVVLGKYPIEIPPEWIYIEDPGYRMIDEVEEDSDGVSKLEVIEGVIQIMANYYSPSDKVLEAFKKLEESEKEVEKRCRLIYDEGKNTARGARSLGYMIDIEEIKRDLKDQGVKDRIDLYNKEMKPVIMGLNKVLEEEKYYPPEQQDIMITRDYYYKTRKKWLEKLKIELEKMKVKYVEGVKEMELNKGKMNIMQETFMDMSRVTKRDIRAEESTIAMVEKELNELKENLNKRIRDLNQTVNLTSKIAVKSRISHMNEVKDGGSSHEEVANGLRSLLTLVRECKRQIETKNLRDPELEKFIVELYKKEHKNWKKMGRCKARHGAEGKIREVGENPTFFILMYEKMKARREYIISGKRQIISYDNLCMSQAEKEEADEIVSELKNKESEYMSAQAEMIKGVYMLEDYNDVQMRKNYSRSVGIEWDQEERAWKLNYIEAKQEESFKSIGEYKILMDRYKMIFGTDPLGVVIGSKGEKMGDENKRSKSIRATSNPDLRGEILSKVMDRDFSEVKVDEFAEETLHTMGYQGAEVNMRSNMRRLQKSVEINAKTRSQEIARLKLEKMTVIEHIYNIIKNDKEPLFMDGLVNEKIEEWESEGIDEVENGITESKNRRGSGKEMEKKKGIIIKVGCKMERELSVKKTLSKKSAEEIYAKIKEKKEGQFLSKNRYEVDDEKELLKTVGEYVDMRFKKDKLLYKVKDHPRNVKYYEKKRIIVQESIKLGASPEEIVEIKNNFNIENNSNANKKYGVTGVKNYIKVVMMMRLTGTNESKDVRDIFGVKRSQSNYMRTQLEKVWSREVKIIRSLENEEVSRKKKIKEEEEEELKRKGKTKEESSKTPNIRPKGLKKGFLFK